MQIVYLSNRAAQLSETMVLVSQRMPFITQAVICGPQSMGAELASTAIPSRFIAESDLLTKSQRTSLARLDHQSRNYLLRRELIARDFINDEFILSDDDARPLRTLSLSTFKQGNKHRNYYFYELGKWQQNQTEFDAGQISTWALLQQLELPQLAYASHMPQIIWRDLYREASRYFAHAASILPLCEWSTYFNFARHLYPDQFAAPEPYVTLCWPEHPLAWKPYCEPNIYLFENYTPSLYQGNHVFARSADKADSSLDTVKKIIAWKQYALAMRHPEQRPGLVKYLNPRTWVNKYRSWD